MELKDEEIMKALECCSTKQLSKCLECKITKNGCAEFLASQALDLINRQQVEIEKLKWEKDHFEFKVDDLNGKLEKFKEYRDIKNGAYEREIEKLRAENERLNGNLFTISNACMQRRNEAIKEFAERLKMKAYRDNGLNGFLRSMVIDVNDIDNLLAEMVGGENA